MPPVQEDSDKYNPRARAEFYQEWMDALAGLQEALVCLWKPLFPSPDSGALNCVGGRYTTQSVFYLEDHRSPSLEMGRWLVLLGPLITTAETYEDST